MFWMISVNTLNLVNCNCHVIFLYFYQIFFTVLCMNIGNILATGTSTNTQSKRPLVSHSWHRACFTYVCMREIVYFSTPRFVKTCSQWVSTGNYIEVCFRHYILLQLSNKLFVHTSKVCTYTTLIHLWDKYCLFLHSLDILRFPPNWVDKSWVRKILFFTAIFGV